MAADVVVCFLVATAISFFGSVQLGPVNLRVIHATYHHGMGAAWRVALGGVLPEILYSFGAIWFAEAFMHLPGLSLALEVVALGFFLVSGLILFFRKEKPAADTGIRHGTHFFTGLAAALFNPLLLPFWLMVTGYLTQTGMITLESFSNKAAFILGTAAGALLLLVVFAVATHRKKSAIEKLTAGRFNRWIGVLFLVLALAGGFRLLV